MLLSIPFNTTLEKQDVKVSVIIPLYNKAKVFRRCVESMINQTYRNIEILIWDDCSTDNSLDSIKDISDPRIRIDRGRKNVGPAEARNNIFKRATGDFVALQDADDYSHPKRIELQLAAMAMTGRLASGCMKKYFSNPKEQVYADFGESISVFGGTEKITVPSYIIPRLPMIFMMPELRACHEHLWSNLAAVLYDFAVLAAPLYMYSLEIQDDRYSDPVKYEEVWKQQRKYRNRARQLYHWHATPDFLEYCVAPGVRIVWGERHNELLNRLIGMKPTPRKRGTG